jgi:drug/metabolite transporter (DMT)-like permease
MRAIRGYLIVIAIASMIVVGLVMRNSGGKVGPDYWESLFLNIAAGLLCLALGSLLALKIASRSASAKLELLAKPLVNLIAELRLGETITPQAARCAVICTVGLISENHLRKLRVGKGEAEEKCAVCGLDTTMDEDKTGCGHCGLRDHLWHIGET